MPHNDNHFIDLYDKYFSVTLCPLGKAGPDCDFPCDPAQGTSNRQGICIFESTKWTGSDCSREVLEDLDTIPSSILVVSYVRHRQTTQVHVAQPLFLGLIFIGCLISKSTILAMGREAGYEENLDGTAAVPASSLIPWLYSIGFSITFGSLFAKINRVYRIFMAAATFRRQNVTNQETLSIVGLFVFLDAAILLVWQFLHPLKWERTITARDKFGEPLSSEGHCTSDHWEIYTTIIGGFHLVLMGVACYMCYQARNIPTAFCEAKYVPIAMVSNLQIFVVGVPVLMVLGSDPGNSFFVRSAIIWMNDLVVVCLIFGNIMYSVHFDPATKNDANLIGNSIKEFTAKHRASKDSVDNTTTTTLVAFQSEQSRDTEYPSNGTAWRQDIQSKLEDVKEEEVGEEEEAVAGPIVPEETCAKRKNITFE